MKVRLILLDYIAFVLKLTMIYITLMHTNDIVRLSILYNTNITALCTYRDYLLEIV